MTTESAVQEPQKAEPDSTALDKPITRTGAIGFGLTPRNFDEAFRMASVFAKTALVPKNYQGQPEDILVAMQYGAEIGLPPMAALQSIAVINGKPGVYGDGFLAVIQSVPTYAKHQEFYELADGTRVTSLRQADYANDDTKAVSVFWRKGNPEPFIGTFSIGDAKRAQLWGKAGPWTTTPARMLLWRARGYAGRNGFAAELRGVKTAEELLDTPDEPIIESAPITEPVRRSEKNVTTAANEAARSADTATSPTETAATPDETPKAEPEKKTPPPGQITKGLRITNTLVVSGKDGKPGYYEIHGNKGEAGKVGLDVIFVTRDEQLYRMAASCEGSESRFDLTWHEAKQETTKKAVKILTGLTAAN